MSHKHRGNKGRSGNRGKKNNEQILRREEGETGCKGGRKLLLEQLVTAETTRTPVPSSRANWLCRISLSHTHTDDLMMGVLINAVKCNNPND